MTFRPSYSLSPEASKGNAFTQHLVGEGHSYWTSRERDVAMRGPRQSAVIQRKRAAGQELNQIYGMSAKADATIEAYRTERAQRRRA